MEEGALTVANERYNLPKPFFAIATQSLGDIEGTFPVPETQLDRFFFKLRLAPPTPRIWRTILQRMTEPAGRRPEAGAGRQPDRANAASGPPSGPGRRTC